MTVTPVGFQIGPLLVAAAVMLSAPLAAADTPAVPASAGAEATPGPYGQNAADYTLVFRDEFNGTGLNTAVWNTAIWYEDPSPVRNYRVENGALKIWPKRDAAGNFVKRTIDTDGKYTQTYGYFEMDAKLPIGKGVWPAFWLYAHIDEPGHTDRPEIDIMEAYPGGGIDSGWGDANLHPINYGVTLHEANADYSHHVIRHATKLTDHLPAVDLSAGFHKYGVRWDRTTIRFYFDGQQLGPTYEYHDDYYNKPMYMLLDLWYGSDSGTPDGTTPVGKGNSFRINYVRAWQLK